MESLNDYVIVEVQKPKRKTDGGIELPEGVDLDLEKCSGGTIVSVGPACKQQNTLLIGDFVLFVYNCSTIISEEDNTIIMAVQEEYLICKQ